MLPMPTGKDKKKERLQELRREEFRKGSLESTAGGINALTSLFPSF